MFSPKRLFPATIALCFNSFKSFYTKALILVLACADRNTFHKLSWEVVDAISNQQLVCVLYHFLYLLFNCFDYIYVYIYKGSFFLDILRWNGTEELLDKML